MSPSSTDAFGTRAIHVGSSPSAETGAVIPPISLATTYAQSSIGNHKGFEYSRSNNPNRAAFEAMLASIEAGGEHALAFSSGSATTATVLQAIQSIDRNAHVLSVNDVYGGTFRYMTKVSTLDTSFVDMEHTDDESILSAIRPNTKLIWIESPTNPTLRLISIPRIVRLARSHPANPLVLVDNTFMSPFYASPLLAGADIAYHSLSKYVNGHSDVIMGALILPAHHSALVERLRFLQNAIGAIPSPFDCWLAQRGAKTLHLRMKAHGLNALHVAQFLESRIGKEVKDVVYPGLASHPLNELAYSSLSPHARAFVDTLGDRHANGGFPFGGMISFRILPAVALKDSSTALRETSDRFFANSRLFTLAESLGGVESLAELPAEMTHGSIPPKERELLGIGDDLIRLSVGVEEGEDLIKDIQRALELAVYGVATKSTVGTAVEANGNGVHANGIEEVAA